MSAYLTAVLADNPKHYWRCADPGGVLAHDIGSSPKHLLQSGSTAPLGYSGPVSDGGAFVESANAGIANSDAELVTIPYSFEIWFWLAYAQTCTFAQCNGPAGFTVFQAAMSAAGTLTVFGSAGIAGTFLLVTPRAWHHLVHTVTGAASNTYLDGVRSGPTAGAGVGSSPTFFFGSNNAGGAALGGAMSEIAMYLTALSAGRVAAHLAAADQVAQAPVFSGAGGFTGVAVSPPYNSLLQQILNSVRGVFP